MTKAAVSPSALARATATTKDALFIIVAKRHHKRTSRFGNIELLTNLSWGRSNKSLMNLFKASLYFQCGR